MLSDKVCLNSKGRDINLILTALNLYRVVFNIMGGVRNPTPHDSSFIVLMLLTGISYALNLPLIFNYV